MITIAVPSDALISEIWTSLGMKSGAESPYFALLREIESSHDAVALDLNQLHHTIHAPFAVRLQLARSLAWFVDQVAVLQATRYLGFSLDCSKYMECWLRPMCYAPWPQNKEPLQIIQLSGQAEDSFGLLRRWFKEDFRYKRDTLPDVPGLFLIGVEEGNWPRPGHPTFYWQLFWGSKSVELHWYFCTVMRQGDSGRYGIVRNGICVDADYDYQDPPQGWGQRPKDSFDVASQYEPRKDAVDAKQSPELRLDNVEDVDLAATIRVLESVVQPVESESPISPNRHLDQIVDEFEAAWINGEAPNLADFVGRVDVDQQDTLLQRLIPLDVTYCQQNSEPCDASDYSVFGTVAVAIARRELEPRLASTKIAVTLDSSVSPMPSPIGERIRYFGEYELLEEIARGGMGIVYKARQVKLNRIVALKMILSGERAGSEEVRRFKTEAEAAANLSHPGIVPIYEIGEHNGQHYFSMGFIDGDSLQGKLSDGPLTPQYAATVCKSIAEAVAYAHQCGVIHRDLKPANVLLDKSGDPKVTDFGLAKKVESDSGLTQSGAIMGTPCYMPPEQAVGDIRAIGQCSDVYSLGAILYASLTGRPPFQAADVRATLIQVISSEPVSPRVLNPAIGLDLETICLKCLQKLPSRRYSTAIELAEDLDRFLKHRPILARPIGPFELFTRWCRRNQVLAAAVIFASLSLTGVAAMAIWTAYYQTSMLRKSQEQQRIVEGQQFQTLTALTRMEFEQATNDFREDARVRGLLRLAHCLIRAVESGDLELEQEVRLHLGAQHPGIGPPVFQKQLSSAIRTACFNEDGNVAVVVTETEAWKIDAQKKLGVQIREIEDPDAVQAISVNADGTRLFVTDSVGQLKMLSADSNESKVTSFPHSTPVVATTVSGNRLLTMTNDWAVCQWNCDTEKLEFGPLIPMSPTHQPTFNLGKLIVPWTRKGWYMRQLSHSKLELINPQGDPYFFDLLSRSVLDELTLVAVALDETQSWLLTRGADGGVSAWDFAPANRSVLLNPAAHQLEIEKPIAATLFHPEYRKADRRIDKSGLSFTTNRRGVTELAQTASGREICGLLEMGGTTTVAISNPLGGTLLVGDDLGNVRMIDTPRSLQGDPERILLWLYTVYSVQLRDKPIITSDWNEPMAGTFGRYEVPRNDSPELMPIESSVRYAVERRLQKRGGPLFPISSNPIR